MIDLKQFVQAIHDAILLANSSLMDKNLEDGGIDGSGRYSMDSLGNV